MKRLIFWSLLFAAGCGAGVPVPIELDDLAVDVSLDDAVTELERELMLPGGIPDRWPDNAPDVCVDQLITTTGEQIIRVDLTPDPAVDPAGAEQFAPLNDGVVDRMEIDRIALRIEENTLNVPLPALELQAADALEADDRAAWWSLGALGGTVTATGCPFDPGKQAVLAQPAENKEVVFEFVRGGESFLLQQLTDPECAANQKAAGAAEDPLRCKELAIRARTLLVFDTASRPERPRGSVKLRFVLGATFFVNP